MVELLDTGGEVAACSLNPAQELREASDEELTRFKKLVQESRQYDSFKNYLAQEQTDFELTGDSVITVVDEKYVNVSFAVKGGAGYSFFGAVVDYSSGEILSTLSGLHTYTGENIEATYHKNGELLSHLEIAQTGEIVGGFVIDEHGNKLDAREFGQYIESGFWSCLNSCLSGLGIPMWIISALGVACGLICAGTAGAGCFACLYAASAGLGGTLGWCIGVCAAS